MHYVYMLQSKSCEGQRYVGITSDLKRRLAQHNAGESPHTSKYLPWRLVAYVAFSDAAKSRDLRALFKVRFGSRLRQEKALVGCRFVLRGGDGTAAVAPAVAKGAQGAQFQSSSGPPSRRGLMRSPISTPPRPRSGVGQSAIVH